MKMWFWKLLQVIVHGCMVLDMGLSLSKTEHVTVDAKAPDDKDKADAVIISP